MSNRTQILCNKNNRRILLLIEQIKEDIKDNLRAILELKTEEKELINNMSSLKRNKKPRINYLLVRLGRLQEFIKGYEDYNNHKQDYLKYCLTKLVIC